MRDTWKIREHSGIQKLRICGFSDRDMNLNLSRQFFQNAKIRNRFPLYQNIHSKKSSDPRVPFEIFESKFLNFLKFLFRFLKISLFIFQNTGEHALSIRTGQALVPLKLVLKGTPLRFKLNFLKSSFATTLNSFLRLGEIQKNLVFSLMLKMKF